MGKLKKESKKKMKQTIRGKWFKYKWNAGKWERKEEFKIGIKIKMKTGLRIRKRGGEIKKKEV